MILFLVSLAACSKPTETLVPTSIDKMESIKPQIDKLSPEERDLFIKYMARHALANALGGYSGAGANSIPQGITIGQAIENQREFIEKQQLRLKELRAKRQQWQLEIKVDEFTDQKRYFASIQEESEMGSGFLHVGCFPSGIEVKLSTGKYIGEGDVHKNVKYRVGGNTYVVTTMKSSKEFVYENNSESDFLKSLMSGERIIIELTSYDYSTSSAKFSLKGAESAIGKVLDACKDKNIHAPKSDATSPSDIKIDTLIAQLADKDQESFVQVAIAIKVEDQNERAKIIEKNQKIRSAILSLISKKNYKDLSDDSGKEKLANEVKTVVKKESGVLPKTILFSNFVVHR